MNTRLPRPFAAFIAAVGVTAVTVSALVALGVPAQAKPPVKPGPVTGLAMTLTKPADNFTVDASWTAAANATTYVVALTNATTGAALAGNSVGGTTWSASVNLTGVTQVRLTVTPYNTRSGPAASITQDVPDLSAPNGTFTVSWVDRSGTITQTALTDDGPVGQISRTVSWGDGTAAVAWNGGTTINHLYAADGLYRPTVTLTDGVGNTRVVNLAAIVPGDKTAPVGTFTTSPGKAWEGLTPVNLTQTALSDDFSAAADVLRWINWGDGTAVEPWTASITASHLYAVAGIYTPSGRAQGRRGQHPFRPGRGRDRPGRHRAPACQAAAAQEGRRRRGGSWKKVFGQATDDKGTGVDSVAVVAIEKRATGWYFFKATSKTWAKAATKGKAWKRAKAAVVEPSAKGPGWFG